MKRIAIIMSFLFFLTILLITAFEKSGDKNVLLAPVRNAGRNKSVNVDTIHSIGEIPLPTGFPRVGVGRNSFAEWLRNIKLRKDNTIYLFNGQPKDRQDLHYAVLDISTGNKDLQQCADCIMRLRAEYYFSGDKFDSIFFISGTRSFYFKDWLKQFGAAGKDKHVLLMQFLQKVFMNCGTYTIEQMTKSVKINDMQPGDVFIKAGAPGHTMIVTDMAVNPQGKKIYLLAQGYMPAQDMHIVINAMNSSFNPWYEVNNDEKIITPGWVFSSNQLKRFH